MWLFPLIVTAALLPALMVLAVYRFSLARPIDDPEIKARRRWRMISRGNTVWIMALLVGLIAIARAPVPGFSLAARAAVSVLFVVIAYCPLVITLGIVDRKIRALDYPIAGYLKFQFAFFFCRWTSFLIVITVLYIFLGLVNGRGAPLPATIALTAGGAALFIAASLFQMRLVGRATGMLTAAAADQEPAASVGALAARAGVTGVRVYIMETFGYPFYNAFAAPGKRIYITRPVVGALTHRELLAIAAHEIGHLVTMRRRAALMLALLTAAVVGLWFLVPRLAWIVSDIGNFVFEIAAVLVFMIIAVVCLSAVSRRYETRADATATSLMEGNEAVIGALEKIYALNMLPRRFDKKGSENASHPSLERRVAQLRGEKLPAPKRKARWLSIIALAVLILICLWLLSFFDERPATPAYPPASYGEAVRSLEERLAADPDNFEILKHLAIEYYSMEEDERALETIDRALAVKQDPGLLMLEGFILSWWGDVGGALSAMENAYREGAGPQACRWAIALAVDFGDTGKARDYLSALRAIDPEDPYAEKMERYLSGTGGEYPFPGYHIVFQGTGR